MRKGKQIQNDRVASPEGVPIHYKPLFFNSSEQSSGRSIALLLASALASVSALGKCLR